MLIGFKLERYGFLNNLNNNVKKTLDGFQARTYKFIRNSRRIVCVKRKH